MVVRCHCTDAIYTFWIRKSQHKHMEDEIDRRRHKPKPKRKRGWKYIFCCTSQNNCEFEQVVEVVDGYWLVPSEGQCSTVPPNSQILQQIRPGSELSESISADIPYRCFEVEAEIHHRPEERADMNLSNETPASLQRISLFSTDTLNERTISSNYCTGENYTPHIPNISSDNCLTILAKGKESDSSINNSCPTQLTKDYSIVKPASTVVTPLKSLCDIAYCSHFNEDSSSHNETSEADISLLSSKFSSPRIRVVSLCKMGNTGNCHYCDNDFESISNEDRIDDVPCGQQYSTIV